MADPKNSTGPAKTTEKGAGGLIGLAAAISLAAGIGVYAVSGNKGGDSASMAPPAQPTTAASSAASGSTTTASTTGTATTEASSGTSSSATAAQTSSTAAAGTTTAAATTAVTATPAADAPAAEFPLAQLLEPGVLPDISLGEATAPVTIVEYASTTCSHCASFHKTVLPGLKSKFIDTGKARLVFREFPRDNLDAAVYMLARCLDSSKYMPFVGVMFENQEKWAFAEGDPVARLLEYAKQAGFTEESFKKCLSDQALLDKLLAARTRAVDVFKVGSTPTVFVNGIRFDGGTLEELEALLAKLGVN